MVNYFKWLHCSLNHRLCWTLPCINDDLLLTHTYVFPVTYNKLTWIEFTGLSDIPPLTYFYIDHPQLCRQLVRNCGRVLQARPLIKWAPSNNSVTASVGERVASIVCASWRLHFSTYWRSCLLPSIWWILIIKNRFPLNIWADQLPCQRKS